ncbi:hypothetical protein BGZ94_001145 [Podila epigama]|nr:hypothetical protein BGZ94_001145 [Podila epigama]
MAGRQLGNSFSEQTWEVLLKVILGITDSLLREQLIKPSKILMPEHTKMSDDLCEHLLRVLFELWLRSNIRQVHMWDILKRCFNGWTHRIPVLHQWAASSLGLCQRVVRLLYGPGQGTDVVNLAVGGYNIGLDLQADFVLYAWHRVIYLLRSPSKLSPVNCLAAVNGVGRMVETFLLVGHNNQSSIPGSPPLPSTPTDIFSSSSLSLSHHSKNTSQNGNSHGNGGAACKPTAPDGNTIMHMFGSWLFEVATASQPLQDKAASQTFSSQWTTFSSHSLHPNDSYHEAQASAFGVLCRIFSKPQPPSRPFLRIYTERFYEALSTGLRSETSLPTILAHSTELFTSELEGVRMMVPDFVIGIRMAMSGQIRVSSGYMSQEKQQQILEDLHLAALKVAGCIMCLPNHFEKVELKEGWNIGLSKSVGLGSGGGSGGNNNGNNNGGAESKAGREDKEILAQLIRVLYTPEPTKDGTLPANKRFTTLKYYILEMLLNCLETETSSFNLRYLLHLIEVYVFEDVAFCPGLVGVVVPVDVALCAFDVLVGCAGLYEYVRRDSKSCARELVLALCRYVDALFVNHTLLSTNHALVVRAYECMMAWILAGQWIVGDQDCHLAVISSISNGIHIVERVEEYEASVVPPKPQQEKRRWGTGAAGNAMISAVGAPLSLGKPSSNSIGASKLFQVNNKYPGPIKILNQEFSKKDKKNRSANSSISGGGVKPSRVDLMVIQHAAEMAMIQFSNQLGNFPVWTDDIGPSRMSTLWDDLRLNREYLGSLKGGGESLVGQKSSQHEQQGSVLPQMSSSLSSSMSTSSSALLDPKHYRRSNGFMGQSQSQSQSHSQHGVLRQDEPKMDHVHDEQGQGGYKGPVRYFLLDRRVIMGCCEVPRNTALSFLESPEEQTEDYGGHHENKEKGSVEGRFRSDNNSGHDGSSFVVMTMRDASGKNSWKLHMRPSQDRMSTLKEQASRKGERFWQKQQQQHLQQQQSHQNQQQRQRPKEDAKSRRKNVGSEDSGNGASDKASAFVTSMDHDLSGNTDADSAAPRQQGPPVVVVESSDDPPTTTTTDTATTLPFKATVLTAEAADEESIGLRKSVRPNPVKTDMRTSTTKPNNADHSGDSHNGNSSGRQSDNANDHDGEGEGEAEACKNSTFDQGESTLYSRRTRQQDDVRSARPDVFRVLIAQMGYLSLENRHRIVPLQLSENLLSELETLDNLKERDCIGVSVYYAQSGDIDYAELIHGSPLGLSKDFSRFLDCLGWPIEVESHAGYLGQLNKENCHTTPYYADRSCEVIFHVPYLMRSNCSLESSSMTTTATMSGAGSMLYDHQLMDEFRSVTCHDQVAVVWVKERERMVNLIPLIDHKVMVYILIHPLGGGCGDAATTATTTTTTTTATATATTTTAPGTGTTSTSMPSSTTYPSTTADPTTSRSPPVSSSSTTSSASSASTTTINGESRKAPIASSSSSAGGLFWIRILIHGSTVGSVRLAANPLVIGPLSDGMLVSRHSLGHLVRNTAISADRACRQMADTFSEPSAVRARFIQEMLRMHQPEEPERISA